MQFIFYGGASRVVSSEASMARETDPSLVDDEAQGGLAQGTMESIVSSGELPRTFGGSHWSRKETDFHRVCGRRHAPPRGSKRGNLMAASDTQ